MFRITARTVLELGSELISSDIIAFYELIKNAFDAGSKSGADIFFNVVLRRNAYLQLRTRALASKEALTTGLDRTKREQASLADLAGDVMRLLDVSAGPESVEAVRLEVAKASTLEAFVDHLDEAYSAFNTIEIADSGSGMSLEELTANYLTIGTPSRKREVDRSIAAGDSRSPFLGEKGIGRPP